MLHHSRYSNAEVIPRLPPEVIIKDTSWSGEDSLRMQEKCADLDWRWASDWRMLVSALS